MNTISSLRLLHALLHGRLHARLFVITAAWSMSACAQQQGRAPSARPSSPPVRVMIETTRGSITVDVDSAHAPTTAANFLRYVDGGFYTGGRFHRTVTAANQPRDSVRIAVIQGGPNPERSTSGFAPIVLERTSQTGLHHVDGTISMARSGPNSATSDFFICVGDQPALDFGGRRNPDGQGFAAFGVVIGGMDVVRAIHASPAEGQRLAPPIVITEMRRGSS